ncbi:pentapeptide repeat-containing protein [Solwaraspora sp. WMMD1047]|uniref:pentapeptide repeat-containing protein n=1 Tax=Solwaraspora sp. WMMD1047 TaxID=3016102 RepID=UPI0024166FC5|nr:pentapeptide repeat-containing protein [Solwaraspora sp. WMMD1047]MDG4834088.1 pentapeptide repeat-containing protein [Solwaraspora sp. WMMD1047]
MRRNAESSTEDHSRPASELAPLRIIKLRTVYYGAATIAIVTAAVIIWLWREAGNSPQLRIDAVRTGFTVGFGAGGALALILAARRQWLQERSQDHQERAKLLDHQHLERVASATEHDTRSRRITELYSKSLDQLGSEKAVVRLGGLYALERLAAENPPHRQMIVNVICAYLRMPFDYILDPSVSQDELAVRLAAQRILEKNLYSGGAVSQSTGPTYDSQRKEIDIDLSGASLVDFYFVHCRVGRAMFDRSHFFGNRTLFTGTEFEQAWFQDATFHCPTFIEDAATSDIFLNGACFEDDFCFNRSVVRRGAWVHGAKFLKNSYLVEAKFDGKADFAESKFEGDVSFDGARFSQPSRFSGATFRAATSFDDVDLAALVDLAFDKKIVRRQTESPLLTRFDKKTDPNG